MSPHGDTLDDLLRHELERKAHDFTEHGEHRVELAAVLGRARRIRGRRRGAAAIGVAAAVLAVTAPVLASQHRQPADQGPADPPIPTPVRVHRLSLDDLPTGPSAATGWVRDKEWHAADGSVRSLRSIPGTPLSVAPIGDALVVVATTGQGGLAGFVLRGDDPGPADRVEQLGTVAGGLAVSPGRSVIALARPDGEVIAVQDDGTVVDLPAVPTQRYSEPDPVAILGEDCRVTATPPGCVVFVTVDGSSPTTTWMTGSALSSQSQVEGIPMVTDARDDLVVGMVRSTEDGSCSAVRTIAGERLWRTCDARLTTLSPSGDRLLAGPAYGDGLGDGTLSVFATESGERLLRMQTARDAAITDARWEDDTHVLALLVHGERWGVVRIGLDGRVESALPTVRADPNGDSPYLLPAR